MFPLGLASVGILRNWRLVACILWYFQHRNSLQQTCYSEPEMLYICNFNLFTLTVIIVILAVCVGSTTFCREFGKGFLELHDVGGYSNCNVLL